MQNMKFYNLVIIIFNQTFGIKKDKNEERHGAFPDLFPTYQLRRDLEDISHGKPIRDSSIYIAAINRFFNSDNPQCIDKTTILIERLESEGYLSGLSGVDISTKCDQNTLSIYNKLILDIWNYYYSQYLSDTRESGEVYSISQSVLDSIICEYSKYRLPVSLEFYQQRLPDIIALKNKKNPDSLYTSIETEYVYFFKNVLENNLFYTLSREDRTIFFNTLYSLSDILDQIHHKDSYRINLELLTFFNGIYADNYNNICVDDIRRIQGCIYAISIENTNASLQGNMKLTRSNNITRIDTSYKPITITEKLDLCSTALKNLLFNKKLQPLDNCFQEECYIPLYENRLRRRRDIKKDEIENLRVLSLIYSNIAACTLQYVKNKIDLDTHYDKYIEICELYHERSGYIRNLIVRITKNIYGEKSSEYKDALLFLAAYYHSVATRYFYMKKFAKSIVIRSVLYSFFMSLDLKEKAHTQLELAPVDIYEQNGGNNIYSNTTEEFFMTHSKNFYYLSTYKLMPYNDFKMLVNEYKRYKELF